MRFKFIPHDTDEWSFETLYMILLTDLQVHQSQQTVYWPLFLHKIIDSEYYMVAVFVYI